jgi:hypothetical protein
LHLADQGIDFAAGIVERILLAGFLDKGKFDVTRN